MSIRGFEKLSHMPQNLKGHVHSAQVWVHAQKKSWKVLMLSLLTNLTDTLFEYKLKATAKL